jgi:hypothetical protein
MFLFSRDKHLRSFEDLSREERYQIYKIYDITDITNKNSQTILRVRHYSNSDISILDHFIPNYIHFSFTEMRHIRYSIDDINKFRILFCIIPPRERYYLNKRLDYDTKRLYILRNIFKFIYIYTGEWGYHFIKPLLYLSYIFIYSVSLGFINIGINHIILKPENKVIIASLISLIICISVYINHILFQISYFIRDKNLKFIVQHQIQALKEFMNVKRNFICNRNKVDLVLWRTAVNINRRQKQG